jgi:hypothetical protein
MHLAALSGITDGSRGTSDPFHERGIHDISPAMATTA